MSSRLSLPSTYTTQQYRAGLTLDKGPPENKPYVYPDKINDLNDHDTPSILVASTKLTIQAGTVPVR
jgi:hypothetical protein